MDRFPADFDRGIGRVRNFGSCFGVCLSGGLVALMLSSLLFETFPVGGRWSYLAEGRGGGTSV